MEIIEIGGGAITVEMQSDEAMDIAIACRLAEVAIYSGHAPGYPSVNTNARERRYETLCATFEALAVAGNAYYSITDSKEAADASLSALRAMKR